MPRKFSLQNFTIFNTPSPKNIRPPFTPKAKTQFQGLHNIIDVNNLEPYINANFYDHIYVQIYKLKA